MYFNWALFAQIFTPWLVTFLWLLAHFAWTLGTKEGPEGPLEDVDYTQCEQVYNYAAL